METIVVLFNRDLRVRDHPALAAACSRGGVVPLFVLDPAIEAGHRREFLHESLHDLRASLRRLGGDLVVRHGDPVAEAMRVAGETSAAGVWASADVSAFARRREQRLAEACETHRLEFRTFPGVTVVPPGALTPPGGDHYKIFTPYWRVWSAWPGRPVLEPPERVRLPHGLAPGSLPALSPEPFGVVRGGETEGLRRMDEWVGDGLGRYGDTRDHLAARTSMLSAYLHFGCVSPNELARRAGRHRGGDDYVRQLCWRDFHHQVTHAFPGITRHDYRPRGRLPGRTAWGRDADAEAAWREGTTGVPVVDAGMRQLRREGWMHNRARLIVGSYLTKRLGIDWRVGADHFARLLLDADVPNNFGNWQWVAGTGNDTRPNRTLNPVRQARRFDPCGEYVRRYVPELASLPDDLVHEPWRAPVPVRGYPRRPLGGEISG
ncbi:deoxyribodipyrimidine photo-lyase [Microbispora sp. RL4-1S]|uniref:Deoxyribodipyrimidine photo-lyase n=1 Tax=Microbispora oryzae TaxID=2806554 RepID=A0A940WNI2_9ACTN|nr:deoxyribodipyrimidine photo-lyase [Microbispora oryzae]MBP2708158.1 deoxyribodipyrimidine photo-lyase [Microbispora oryzae]